MAAPLLAAWADAAGLSRPAAPPGAFANGYLFGQLLARHGLQPDFGAFRDDARADSALRNFCALAGSLRGLGVELSAQSAARIARGDDGAASQLLLWVRGAVISRPPLAGGGGGASGDGAVTAQLTPASLTGGGGGAATAAAAVARVAHRPRRAAPPRAGRRSHRRSARRRRHGRADLFAVVAVLRLDRAE